MRPEHFCKATFQQPAKEKSPVNACQAAGCNSPKPCSRIDLPQGGRSSRPFHLEAKVATKKLSLLHSVVVAKLPNEMWSKKIYDSSVGNQKFS